MGNTKVTSLADYLIVRLKELEYAIRKTIAVREDQEEIAHPKHVEEAAHCGIHVEADMTKGELLNGVQTLLRANQARQIAMNHASRTANH